MASRNILVVDDEVGIRELLSDILSDEGHNVRLAENAHVARDERLKLRPDLVLLDIWMPDCDGISLLKEWANAGLLTMPVIMMSGHGTIDTAIEATRLGAFDFLEKPIALQKLLKTVGAAIKHSDVLPHTEINLSSFGKSQVIQELKQRLEQLAKSKNCLFLIGKKGGSVELCARFLRPSNAPWLTLIEHDKLVSAPLDILEQCREGILFIEEVTQLSKTEQKGLNLILTKAEKYGTRVICASECGVPTLIEKSMLETPLLQALAAAAVRVPSLNEHKEDIPDLANAMATLMVEASKIDYKSFDVAALNTLRNADWQGDIQELETVVQNLLMTSLGSQITQADAERVLSELQTLLTETMDGRELPIDLAQPLREARDAFERFYFQYHMRAVKSNMSKLAEITGLERTHLYRKLKQLGINIKG